MRPDDGPLLQLARRLHRLGQLQGLPVIHDLLRRHVPVTGIHTYSSSSQVEQRTEVLSAYKRGRKMVLGPSHDGRNFRPANFVVPFAISPLLCR